MEKEFEYTPFSYKDYEESAKVKNWSDKLGTAEQAIANYGDYTWKDQEKYNTLLSQYENRPDFTYDFNADALYQQYKDKYIQQGKMAMADTIGQASAMTGGYGNSYAASVGNQAYQAQLQNLNDVIPQLYQMAYDRYNQKGTDMLNMLSMMKSDRDFDYGVWGDKYNQLVNDRTYYGTMYDNERNFDYGKYSDDRTVAQNEHSTTQGYAYNNYRDAIADEQWQKSYDLSDRELKIAEEKWLQEKNTVNDNSPGNPTPEPESTGPQASDYADWSATDWNSYFSKIRQNEGQSAAEEELNYFTSNGLIPKGMMTYAALGARGGRLGH